MTVRAASTGEYQEMLSCRSKKVVPQVASLHDHLTRPGGDVFP